MDRIEKIRKRRKELDCEAENRKKQQDIRYAELYAKIQLLQTQIGELILIGRELVKNDLYRKWLDYSTDRMGFGNYGYGHDDIDAIAVGWSCCRAICVNAKGEIKFLAIDEIDNRISIMNKFLRCFDNFKNDLEEYVDNL